MASKTFEYLIIGGGNSAGYACKEFVAQGAKKGTVAMIMAEPVVPYERPALTKAYLHPPGAKVRARLPGFHTCVGGGGERQGPEWYEEQGIELIKGRAQSVDLDAKAVKVGEATYGYGKLFLATGCTPRRAGVKGDDLPGIFYIREEADAAALVQALEARKGEGKVVVVGGGYIGLECAAAIVGWGLETTAVLSGQQVFPRLFNAELGQWLETEYNARGVKFLKGERTSEFVGEEAVSSVTLTSGKSLPCDLVVVGVGGTAVVDYCQGLTMDKGGFLVDGSLRTSNPSVYAIGDIATFPSLYGGLERSEHVEHARKSAAHAVRSAMGKTSEPYQYLPYFYSRLFEYSAAPVVFNFFGSEAGKCKVTELGEKSMGAIWVDDDGKVMGALLLGSPGPSAEEQGKLRALVEAAPKVGMMRVKDIFKPRGL